MIPELTKEVFEPYVGQMFRVSPEQGPSVPLKLAKVVETPEKQRKDLQGKIRTEAFSLIFEGSPENALQQGIHTFQHDKMGETTLFAAPIIARDPQIRRYEIVINRLINT
jgi:hypothetical protein